MLRRRIASRIAGVTFVALGLVVAVPGAAAATAPVASSPAPSSADSGGYPAQGPLLTLSAGSVSVGGSVTVTGRGFQSGESVDISVTYPPSAHALGSGGPTAQPAALTLRHSAGRLVSAGHALATANGEFSLRITLTQAGNATVSAIGEQSHVSLTAPISVLPSASAVGTTSSKSGFPLSHLELLILVIALLALLVPAGVAWQRRSRKPSVDPVSAT